MSNETGQQTKRVSGVLSFTSRPVVQTILSILGVFGICFGIWAHLANKPIRELSYRIGVERFASLSPADGLSLSIQGREVSQGDIYLVQVSVWNSGNQEIASTDFLRPLRLVSDFAWDEHRLAFYGLDEGQLQGNLRDGLTVNSLFPQSGLRVSFLSSVDYADAVITGAINGGRGTTKGIKNLTFPLFMLSPGQRDMLFLGFSLAAFVATFSLFARAGNGVLQSALLGVGVILVTIAALSMMAKSFWWAWFGPPF